MKTTIAWVLFAISFYSCSPKFGSAIQSKQPLLPQDEYILVLQREDVFVNDGIEVGTISVGDNGFSVNCTYNEVIGRLKEVARQNGANLIKIIEQKSPDAWNTCERIKAKIYKVPNFRVHEREIEWTATRRLTWEDFKGKPKIISNTNVAAQTYCGFSLESNRVTVFKKVKIFIKNTFDCNLSWVRQDQMSRDDLLEHEQVHFDLSQVYARHLRKNLVEKNLTVNNLTTGTNSVFKDVYNAYLERQEMFETETNYGLDREKQKLWAKKIVEELTELNSWAE